MSQVAVVKWHMSNQHPESSVSTCPSAHEHDTNTTCFKKPQLLIMSSVSYVQSIPTENIFLNHQFKVSLHPISSGLCGVPSLVHEVKSAGANPASLTLQSPAPQAQKG